MKDKKKIELQVLKERGLAIQVCTNAKSKANIEKYTNQANLCGTQLGWVLDEKESRRLKQQAVNCAEKKGFKHYILYA